MAAKPNILVLSAYDAESHKHWRASLVQLQDFEFDVLSLEPRFFSWRVRGNALTWALAEYARLARPYAALVATSMVDLATLKGLVPSLASTPVLLYFHENQFDYPRSHNAYQSVEPQITSIYSALAADKLVFNSQYNCDTFIEGARQLLKKMPDGVPCDIGEQLKQKATVVPVPLGDDWFQARQAKCSSPIEIVWNHRWEYDKGPELLNAIIEYAGEAFGPGKLKWHIVGQQFRSSPPVFDEIRLRLEQQGALGAWGYQTKEDYRAILTRSRVVLSTALHDFQGLSVGEAVASGCVPLLPARVAYPEMFAAEYLYDTSMGVIDQQAKNAITKLADLLHLPAAPDVSGLAWRALAPRYRQLLSDLIEGRSAFIE